ncbi:hypothetical protein LTR62_003387 [Meristemomyces frigidus]|uniref:Swiss Army Knife RNA repair protein HAD domain-containing protein n=1 Tax=Meristemomyces frigidus TaxID=1508187 RepID=A0AAN7TS14_9PEZI|nr:hypothetical protein LTR62_003387 [Meristemomyces frigidus]
MNDSTAVHTVTALKRWSCMEKQLPSIERIRNIHVYDFDNTLFASPLPNRQLWNSSTIGSLQAQEFLHNGGWWHNPHILAATGQGVEAEERQAWKGYWNEKIVELCDLSAADEDTLTIMLTGRGEDKFAELLTRMVTAKKLDFDMLCLKPAVGPSGEMFASTLAYKQALLRDIVYTYRNAVEIRIYEDRPKHTKAFRDFFTDFNRSLSSSHTVSPVPRNPIRCEVIQVTEQEASMDPVAEAACVQEMINTHNAAILAGSAPANCIPYKLKRTVFFTGYMLTPPDIETMKRKYAKLPPNVPEHEVRFLANNILISPRPAPHYIMDKIGGLGAKVRWRVTGTGTFQNRVWAARVTPIDPNVRVVTENSPAYIVIATRREAKPIEATKISHWNTLPATEPGMEFETTVGEKVLLRIEEEFLDEDAYEASFAPSGKFGRKHPREEEFPPLGGARGDGGMRGGRQGFRGGWNGQGRDEGRGPNGGRGEGGWVAGRGGHSGAGSLAPRGGGGGGNRGGRGAGENGRRDRHFRDRDSGGGGRGGGQGGRGRGPRNQYRSLDDSVSQTQGAGYGDAGGMQY